MWLGRAVFKNWISYAGKMFFPKIEKTAFHQNRIIFFLVIEITHELCIAQDYISAKKGYHLFFQSGILHPYD